MIDIQIITLKEAETARLRALLRFHHHPSGDVIDRAMTACGFRIEPGMNRHQKLKVVDACSMFETDGPAAALKYIQTAEANAKRTNAPRTSALLREIKRRLIEDHNPYPYPYALPDRSSSSTS